MKKYVGRKLVFIFNNRVVSKIFSMVVAALSTIIAVSSLIDAVHCIPPFSTIKWYIGIPAFMGSIVFSFILFLLSFVLIKEVVLHDRKHDGSTRGGGEKMGRV